MAYADTLEAKVIEQNVATAEAGALAINPNNIHVFRSGRLNLSRWTRVNLGGLNLPREPFAVLTQVRFPNNASLTVSDNFSVVVAVMNRSRIEVNIWRTDANADPSIDYVLDFMIITN